MKTCTVVLAACTAAVLAGCGSAPVVAPAPAPVPVAAAPVAPVPPPAPPDSEVYLADLDLAAGSVANVRNISRNKGYDNQPSFTPDGDAVWFVSDRSGSTDVYRYDIAAERLVQVTNTRESEFSPTALPDRAGFSATHVKAPDQKGEAYTESQQLWRYSVGGKP